MLRSLYSGVSGMRSNQTKMDVIGNNIANANTTAFKAGRARFQDIFSQTLSSAQSPDAQGKGGVNPQQAGLGVSVAAIDTIFEGGALQPTGRDLDVAIEGDGFFVVSEDTGGVMKRYTRDGAFFKDYEGNLTNAEGLRVLGYLPAAGAGYPTDPSAIEDPSSMSQADRETRLRPLSIPNEITIGGQTVNLEAFSIDGSGLISAVYDDGQVYYLGRLGMAKFKNPEGLSKLGGNTYQNSRNSGEAEFGNPNQEGFGIVRSGSLEMSNVDLANEFTEMIVTSRAYQANSRTITTSDEMLMELINLKR